MPRVFTLWPFEERFADAWFKWAAKKYATDLALIRDDNSQQSTNRRDSPQPDKQHQWKPWS